jgi:hypothetical protein
VSRLTLVIIGSALALAACQTEPGTRFLSSEDSVSFIRPDGWKQHRDRGTLILSLGEEATSPNTIAVRTIAREDGWAEDRTVETVVPATQTVLRALPGSQVSEPAPITERGMKGASFYVRFEPKGAGRAYERQHIVLIGRQRVVHVMHTAPEGFLADTSDAFEQVFETIREEG